MEPLFRKTSENLFDAVDVQLVAAGLLVPTDVSVGDRSLVFELGPEGVESSPATRREALNDFVRLARSDEIKEFQSYGKRYGVLGLEQDRTGTPGLPWGERADAAPARPQPAQLTESRSEWQRHANEARLLLEAVQAILQEGKAFGRWDELNAGPILPEPPYQPRRGPAAPRVDAEASALVRYVQAWLREGQLTPRLEYRVRLRLCFDGDGLISVLAFGLLNALCQPDRVFTCDACGNPYVAGRRPPVGTKHYCPRDRDTGRWKKSQEKTRQKVAAAKAWSGTPQD